MEDEQYCRQHRETKKRPLPYTPEEAETLALQIVGGAAMDTTVVGSFAYYLALKERVRNPRDFDLSVNHDAYRYLREQKLFHSEEGWKEIRLPDGRPWLTNGLVDISIGWGQKRMSHEELTQRGWRAKLAVADMVDVCPWKVIRNDDLDQADNDHLRALLHDHELLLPEHLLIREMEMIRSRLPEKLRDHPDAQIPIYFAANGMKIVFTLYGDPEVKHTGQIIGALEQREYNVPALYHNGFDLLDDLEHLIAHLVDIGASAEDVFDGVVGLAYADAVYGNGRESDEMPGGHDERRSAELVRAHALALGYSKKRAGRLFTIVDQTGFNEHTKKQKGADHPDPVARAVTAVDLQCLSDPHKDSFDICVEDIIAARYSRDRILGRVANKHGIRILSVEQGLAVIDRLGHERPDDIPGAKTLREAMLSRLDGDAWFYRNYKSPTGWTRDSEKVRLQKSHRMYNIVYLLKNDPTVDMLDVYWSLQHDTKV